MLKIIYFIKSEKSNSNDECPIYAKISYQGKSITMSTGKYISKERWKFTSNLRGPLRVQKEKVIKASLDSLTMLFETKFNLLLKNNATINLNEIKIEILGKKQVKTKTKIGLLDIFDIHNKDFERKVEYGERSPASLQKYDRAKNLIKIFLRKKYKIDNIAVEKITGAFIHNLESFLKYESEYKGILWLKQIFTDKFIDLFQAAYFLIST
ncbi:phage integrase SAM-like domain-containing protein [Flavivirga aquimarina]|uniref:Phage integrase SAM-like domain-containing protein n=1 Tax=Flavivirga aquimarina TaxID=2027862 RepID=A0ABT8WDD8_9FLAO|nr:phage integrase SAM-like domain-containing protein [Flavivirga aquimarina]MDO5971036.1 phage integrase SAM-like domain-containing protein [Flavivirga aquimarina]